MCRNRAAAPAENQSNPAKFFLQKNGVARVKTSLAATEGVGNNNSESVFEVQTGVDPSCNNEAVQLYAVCQGPRAGGKHGWLDLGFGFNTPSVSLSNAY
ncbi:hypothetical protein [Hymenobacter psoromatis]|uniref:hypothetical protein n=1 Tax=Hymenobacter psoromatis TaxID=1484116 RepID=UPI001CBB7A5C|nr:hypothetical protein [Hymenobacter psoromatis]